MAILRVPVHRHGEALKPVTMMHLPCGRHFQAARSRRRFAARVHAATQSVTTQANTSGWGFESIPPNDGFQSRLGAAPRMAAQELASQGTRNQHARFFNSVKRDKGPETRAPALA